MVFMKRFSASWEVAAAMKMAGKIDRLLMYRSKSADGQIIPDRDIQGSIDELVIYLEKSREIDRTRLSNLPRQNENWIKKKKTKRSGS